MFCDVVLCGILDPKSCEKSCQNQVCLAWSPRSRCFSYSPFLWRYTCLFVACRLFGSHLFFCWWSVRWINTKQFSPEQSVMKMEQILFKYTCFSVKMIVHAFRICNFWQKICKFDKLLLILQSEHSDVLSLLKCVTLRNKEDVCELRLFNWLRT